MLGLVYICAMKSLVAFLDHYGFGTGSKVTVFCGSGTGNCESFVDQTALLGRELAVRDICTVYGGTHIGLMNVLAQSALNAGGRVIGIIPRVIEEMQFAHKGLTELIIVETIEERKAMLIDKGDVLVALPGSFGTMDELFTSLVLRQLGQISKPIVLMNLNGFYAPVIAQIEAMASAGFLRGERPLVFDTV